MQISDPIGSGPTTTSTDTTRASSRLRHDPRSMFMGLRWSGLTSEEAANLTARLAGIGTAPGGWTVADVQRLQFLRWLVDSGRLVS